MGLKFENLDFLRDYQFLFLKSLKTDNFIVLIMREIQKKVDNGNIAAWHH